MSYISRMSGNKEQLITLSKKAYKLSQGRKKSIQLADVYLVRADAYIPEHKYDESLKLISKCENILKTLTQTPLIELEKRRAYLAWIKSMIFARKGKEEKALEQAKISLTLREKHNLKADIVFSLSTIKEIYYMKGDFNAALTWTERCLKKAKEIDYKYQILFCYTILGVLYVSRGELENSIDYQKQALAYAEDLEIKYAMAVCYNNLGISYHQQGDFSLAQESLENGLELYNQVDDTGWSCVDSLFHLALDKGNLEEAQKYLEKLNQLKDQYDQVDIALMYRVDKAVFLKQSPRAINRGKAEEMLKQIVKEEIFNYEITIIALLHLCDLLLNELQNTSDLDIIDEIETYIIILVDLAEKNHSYLLQAEVYKLQAKLSLVTFEFKESRQSLIKAQNIAEKYHLNRLAIKISDERDELLKQLSIWEEIKETKATLSERMKLARINEQMDHILRKRTVEASDVPDEDPVIVLIVSESGEPIFSHSFDKEWDFEDHLLGGFLTAINSFSDEMFSRGFDRATFGQYNLLMKSVPPFLVCYLYKGYSYLAQQKIGYFVENIQKDKALWQTFNKFHKTSQYIQTKDIPLLKPLITDIFVEKNIPLNGFKS